MLGNVIAPGEAFVALVPGWSMMIPGV